MLVQAAETSFERQRLLQQKVGKVRSMMLKHMGKTEESSTKLMNAVVEREKELDSGANEVEDWNAKYLKHYEKKQNEMMQHLSKTDRGLNESVTEDCLRLFASATGLACYRGRPVQFEQEKRQKSKVF